MNATENGGKGQAEQDMIVRLISMSWTIKRRNVGGVYRENDGPSACHIVANGDEDTDQKKGKCNDNQSDS